MNYVDLHTHSNASDGTCTPAHVVERAFQKGLSAIALTDHDATAGIDKALKTAQSLSTPDHSIQLIPGTELSVAYKKQDIHIVGLCIDHYHAGFQKTSDLLIQRRKDRNEEMVDNLRKAGIPITMNELTKDNPDTVVTRAHFARYLIETGVVSNTNDAFHKYLDQDTPYYVPRKYIQPEEGIELIRAAGGVAILAHPLHYKIPIRELEQLIARLKDAGLTGIEVKYANHSHQDEAYASQLSNRYHLLPSGGSDFHGSNKPAIDIGTGRGNLAVPYSYLEQLAAYCNYPLS